MLHLFCKINPRAHISTSDLDTGPGQVTSKDGARGRINILKGYWPGAGDLERWRPGLDKHSQKLLDPGQVTSKDGARGWINILKSYWTRGR